MINKRIATAVATGALLLNSFVAPAFAATNIQISGNGSDSNNDAKVELKKTTSVVQNNKADVTNKVDVKAQTGGNSASDNTGGDVKIKTGDSTVGVAVKNMLNKNSATVDCCSNGDATVKVSDNGSDSDNKVKLDMKNSNGVFQDNNAEVDNKVNVDSKTGKNEAEDNTNGGVDIKTGDSDVSVGILNMLNSNFAKIGGGDNQGSSLSLWVAGNGSDSKNKIDADIKNENVVKQDNSADIYNKLDVKGDTGYNDANDNTGGDVSVKTGDSMVDAVVANVGNFNWADLSCDCLFDDLTAKIANNGSDSNNKINLDLSDGKDNGVFQDNGAYLTNKLDDLGAKTGNNSAEDNTEGNGDDPSINTGDAGVSAQVMNQLNANEAGIGSGMEFDFNWDEMFSSIFG